MIVVFLLYLLLAMPLVGTVCASAYTLHGEATVVLQFAGLHWVHRTTIGVGENGWPLSAIPIFGVPEKEKDKKTGTTRARRHLETVVRQTARIDRLHVTMRIGLGEAWATALAAGGARAAVFSALSFLPPCGEANVCVIPDFAAVCFCTSLQCIFSVTAGDIMLKAARTAMKKTAIGRSKRFGKAVRRQRTC